MQRALIPCRLPSVPACDSFCPGKLLYFDSSQELTSTTWQQSNSDALLPDTVKWLKKQNNPFPSHQLGVCRWMLSLPFPEGTNGEMKNTAVSYPRAKRTLTTLLQPVLLQPQSYSTRRKLYSRFSTSNKQEAQDALGCNQWISSYKSEPNAYKGLGQKIKQGWWLGRNGSHGQKTSRETCGSRLMGYS